MFNAPRPAQNRYLSASVGTLGNGFGGMTGGAGAGAGAGSFVNDPLAGSVYDDAGLDPWSAAPSPSHTPAPGSTGNNASTGVSAGAGLGFGSETGARSAFSSVIGQDTTIPGIYHRAFALVDTENVGEISVSALSRVLTTSSLQAATVDRIVNLVSSKPRVSKLEFFVALALVALGQAGKDISIEQVAALASQDNLPEPALDLDRLQPSLSTLTPSPSPYRQNTIPGNGIKAAPPSYVPDDPWNSAGRFSGAPSPGGAGMAGGIPDTGYGPYGPPGTYTTRPLPGGASGVASSLAGTGLPQDWWKKLENVKVTVLGQQGFILNRYMVYEVTSDRGPAIPRRYSEFVALWECLLKRYPFRLFPALPPKRVGPDEQFIEQRRRGLARALSFVVNHPIMKDDGILSAFLTEPSFEGWRKNATVSMEEESASKRVDRVEEMAIPSDLDEKLGIIRGKLNPLIDQWQRICILAERIIKRREAAAVRLPSAFQRAYLPAHFSLSLFSPPSPPPLSGSASSVFSNDSGANGHGGMMASGILSLSTTNLAIHRGWGLTEEQGDMSRLTNTLRAVVEVNEPCWRGDVCELSNGVRTGLEQLAVHSQRYSEISELRTRALFDGTLEALKAQRDLYLATRDLFIRHDRLSSDQVDKLKKRVETNSHKLDGARAAQKDGWQEEADRLAALVEKDQAAIAASFNRRVFTKACMWHEVSVVLHNRENALLSQAVQTFAREEHEFTERVLDNWISLADSTENMPFE